MLTELVYSLASRIEYSFVDCSVLFDNHPKPVTTKFARDLYDHNVHCVRPPQCRLATPSILYLACKDLLPHVKRHPELPPLRHEELPPTLGIMMRVDGCR